jgi:hypothetical protein
VDHVHAEQQRDAEARLLDRRALHLAGLHRAPQIADRADPAGTGRLQIVDRPSGPVTARPAETRVIWPIFSSSVMRPSKASISVDGSPAGMP